VAAQYNVEIVILGTVRVILQQLMVNVSYLPGACRLSGKYHSRTLRYIQVEGKEKARKKLESMLLMSPKESKDMNIDLEAKTLFENIGDTSRLISQR
jgi:hypothetical protein